MPHYLDSIWGDNNTIKGFGDALNNNLASVADIRFRQRQADQAAALNAAYLGLARQKQQMEEPEMTARTQLYQTQNTDLLEKIRQAQQEHSMIQALGPALQQRYLQANPPMQREMVPQQPPGIGNMQTNVGPGGYFSSQFVPPPQMQQGPVMGSSAPTMENMGRQNQAMINAAIAQEMMKNPQTAEALLKGTVMSPGEQKFNLVTGQKEQEVPYQIQPYQQGLLDQRRIQQDLYGDRTDVMRDNSETGKFNAETRRLQEQKPPKTDRFADALANAKGGGGGTPSNRMTATNPSTGQRIVSDDGGKTWHPLTQ